MFDSFFLDVWIACFWGNEELACQQQLFGSCTGHELLGLQSCSCWDIDAYHMRGLW